jgi:hypothetical protein
MLVGQEADILRNEVARLTAEVTELRAALRNRADPLYLREGGMVLRVARVLYGLDNEVDGDFATDDPVRRGYYLRLSRAAIAAMRQPTEEMTVGLRDLVDPRVAETVWQRMIDAALEE